MTENPASSIGRSVIDAYLDSVEQALLAANAPRSDRAQVLEDLDSQMADMLGPQPLTEEIVRAVIARLEPASHFAAMYGNGKQPRVAAPVQVSSPRGIRWSYIAAACFAVSILGGVLMLAAIVGRPVIGLNNTEIANLLQTVMLIALMFGYVATPGALGIAYHQLRTQSGSSPDRNLLLSLLIAYAILAPALAMVVLTEWTYGLALVPFGFAGFIYLQYWLARRLHGHLTDRLPPHPTNGNPSENRPPKASQSLSGAMTMPAM